MFPLSLGQLKSNINIVYTGAKVSLFSLRKHPHMFYTPSFTLLYSRKGEMRGTQNEGLFSGLD